MLLLTSVLLVWKRSLLAAVRLLAVQGAALAGMVAVIGVFDRDLQLVAVAGLVLALKGVVLPWVLDRSRLRSRGGARGDPAHQHHRVAARRCPC